MSGIGEEPQLTPRPGRLGRPLGRGGRLRVQPARFSVALGLAGLATAWHAAGVKLGTPTAVPNAIDVLAAAVLFMLAGLYAAQGRRHVLADLRDPVQAPFMAIPSIAAMMLAAALARQAFAAGRALVVIFLAVTIGVGGWLTGQWMSHDGTRQPVVHPGYYLPTIAGGLVGAITLAQVHLLALADVSFGLGVASWLLLGSVVLSRLTTGERLPAAPRPTLAI